MILILNNKNKHIVRLEQGLVCCGKRYKIVSDANIPDEKYDLVLVDPTYEYDIFRSLKYKKIGFFDCEDDPKHFEPGSAYAILKDKAQFYAKVNFIEDDRKDRIKNVAFPIAPYFMYKNVAATPLQKPTKFVPFFMGTPTFIGRSDSFLEQQSIGDVFYVAKYEDHYIYNQRYHWLLELYSKNIPYVGGIVFSHSNVSLAWQQKVFGNVEKFSKDQISQNDYLSNLAYHGIGLCPTGYDRLSWRHFDIMATGAIMFRTDHRKQSWLYNPIEFVTVKDTESIAEKIEGHRKDFNELHNASSKNREILASLTPEIVWKAFTDQLI